MKALNSLVQAATSGQPPQGKKELGEILAELFVAECLVWSELDLDRRSSRSRGWSGGTVAAVDRAWNVEQTS
jgi:hypothetical protein